MRFTHGYGLVSMPINKVSSEGQPLFFVKDIPLVYDYGYSKINQPRIYFSENKDEYSHEKASEMSLEYAVSSISVPFHPGAERYFKEVGAIS